MIIFDGKFFNNVVEYFVYKFLIFFVWIVCRNMFNFELIILVCRCCFIIFFGIRIVEEVMFLRVVVRGGMRVLG